MSRTAIAMAIAALVSITSPTWVAADNSASSGAGQTSGDQRSGEKSANKSGGMTNSGDPAQAETAHQAGVLDDKSDPAMRQANFDKLDQNQDGKLDEEELNAHGATAAGSAADTIEEYDTDGDGAISQEEMEMMQSPD